MTYGYEPRFQIGDHVYIARLNKDAELPDDDCSFAGHFSASYLGREIIISEKHEYDRKDNSWDFWDDEWVHEGALELVKPLTQEEEDAAVASIREAALRAIAPADGYRPEDF